MPQVISATDAKNQFSDLVNRVVYNNEEFIVQKQGKPVVLITRATGKRSAQSKKFTTNDFLLKLATYNFKGPKDLSKNLDKYAWE